MSTGLNRTMMLVASVRRRLAALRRRSLQAPTIGAATLDLNAAGIANDPLVHYEALRAAGTVHFLAHHRAWIVLGHDEVHWAFKRPEIFSNQPYQDVDAVLLAADPPLHSDVRRAISPYFSRDVIEALGAFAAERAASLLDSESNSSREGLDVVAGYARPLSEAVAARLLGFDDTTVDAIRASAMRASGFHQHLHDIGALAHRANLYERLREDGLDDASVRSLVRLFWVASTATTERVLAECVLALLDHSDARTAVEADPTLLTAFIEEVMRLHPPEPMLRRRTKSGVDLGGAHIPAAADVYLCLAAANRDPRRYLDPSALRLDRGETRPLIFGHGIHHCIGATLGRTTVATALRALLTHHPRFRAAQTIQSIQRCTTMMANHIESLVIDTVPSRIRSVSMAPAAGHDLELPDRLARDGYVIVDAFLDAAENAALLEVFHSLDSPTHHKAWGPSMFSSDLEYRAAVDRAIKAALASRAAALLPGYRIFFCNFLVKEPDHGDAGVVQIHQDPTFVDEDRYDTVGLWIPLVDTNAENGAIRVLPGSHRWNRGPRGYGGCPSPYLDRLPTFMKQAQVLPMQAGAALVFSQKLFHGSAANRSRIKRVTAAALLKPNDAQLYCYYANPSLPGKLEVFEVDDFFFSRYPYGTTPEGVPRVAVVDHWHDPIEPQQLGSVITPSKSL